MATQHEIIEALKQRGLAYEQLAELQQFSGAYRKLPAVGKTDVFWYVRNNDASNEYKQPQLRRGKSLAQSVPVDVNEMLKPLPGVDPVFIPPLAAMPALGLDVIALLVALRDMVHAYWGRPGDERAGDGIHPPPEMVVRAKALLDRYAGLLPPGG